MYGKKIKCKKTFCGAVIIAACNYKTDKGILDAICLHPFLGHLFNLIDEHRGKKLTQNFYLLAKNK